MEYQIKVEISLKRGLSDPEGETSAASLRDLGYNVREVHISKLYYIHVDETTLDRVNQIADEMCRRLLSNPVKDDYRFYVERIGTP